MKPPARWPLHPTPVDGEALSSWLYRLAACYQMEMLDLVKHGLGHDHDLDPAKHDTACDHLDSDPPEMLVLRLAQHTGVDPDRIREMTLAGWAPWLYDSLHPSPAGFDVYVRQFSVLLNPHNRGKHQPKGPWRAWQSDRPVRRGCPQCLGEPGCGVQLIWQLPLMLSCPKHGCLLQPFLGATIEPYWLTEECETGTPIASVVEMDARTHQALTTGQVDLPRRSIHAAIWFRLLRTLINELSTPATYWNSRADDLRLVWANSDPQFRVGQTMWRPIEALPWLKQAQLLKAAAVAINLLQEGTLTGRGSEANLFTPAPHVPVDSGAPGPKPTSTTAFDLSAHLATISALWDAAVQEAKDDPAAAQALYDLCMFGSRTPLRAQEVLDDFVELGIPVKQLSHKQQAVTLS